MQQNGGLINGEKSDVLGGRKGIPEMKWDNAILWGSLNGRVFSWELIFPKLQYLWNLLLLQEGIHEKIQGGEIKNVTPLCFYDQDYDSEFANQELLFFFHEKSSSSFD